MTAIVLPIALFAGIALLAGLLLTYLSRRFPGETTDDEVAVRSALPGLNCGLCGYPNCDAYATDAATNKVMPNLCVPGGIQSAQAISAITGVPYDSVKELVAFVSCNGNYDATRDKYNYRGVLSCAASAQYYGGRSSCRDGCLGFGDCVSVCPYGAISVINGCAVVDPAICTGCLLCAKTCPKHIIISRPKHTPYLVACSSRAAAKETRQTCKNGCVLCNRCVKACPSDAIAIVDNSAVIDPARCTGCGACIEACAFGVIVDLRPTAPVSDPV